MDNLDRRGSQEFLACQARQGYLGYLDRRAHLDCQSRVSQETRVLEVRLGLAYQDLPVSKEQKEKRGHSDFLDPKGRRVNKEHRGQKDQLV
ncbi:UNVERIFIED_CONTAM: hypothetical protein K2H54_077021 [Gekko kuhli]